MIFITHIIQVRIFFLSFIVNPSLNLFATNDGKCPICYMDLFIPTYIQNCNHSFCYCCLVRWLENNNSCPLCRQQIKQIGYIDSKAVNGKIIINATQFRIENKNIQNNNSKDSILCLKCKKSDPCNQLLLCNCCKYNLTHITCGRIEMQKIQNFICDDCDKKQFE